ncbi:MAG: hypothetical protein NTV51_01525 [Verrucomicrobia bacterium]|nr:hypothetical protein [Verrucomicrobiota bacterium]
MPSTKLGRQLGGLGLFVFWSVVFGFLGVCLWFAFTCPPAAWVLGPCIITYTVLARRSLRDWKRLQEERKRETIGTFARALPARAHDTWVVRAVYEELSRNRRVSVRPSDRLVKDLELHWDEFDICLEEIGRRARRSLADTKKNPLRGRLVTVADVVTFVEHQPRMIDAEREATATKALG